MAHHLVTSILRVSWILCRNRFWAYRVRPLCIWESVGCVGTKPHYVFPLHIKDVFIYHCYHIWTIPCAPCMVYLPTKLGDFVRANVGIHIPAPWFAYGNILQILTGHNPIWEIQPMIVIIAEFWSQLAMTGAFVLCQRWLRSLRKCTAAWPVIFVG